MTRRPRRERSVETRLTALESEQDHEERIFVVSIGGDPDKPRGWVTPEKYEQHYDENSDTDFSFNIDWGGPEP